MAVKGSWHAKSVRRALLDQDLEATRPFMQGRVLEIGAGRNHRRGDFIPSITNAWVFLDLGQKNLPDVRADALQLPFRSKEFETVICLEVFEYISNPAMAVLELRRVIKPSGLLILSTPFVHRQDADTDRLRWTERGLVELFEQAGLEIVSLKAQGYLYATIASLLRTVIVEGTHGRFQNWLLSRALAWLLKKDAEIKADSSWAKISTGYLVVGKVTV